MDLVLKSELSDHVPQLVRPQQRLGLLLVYQDIGFVNSAVELLRDAAGRIEATGPLFCTIWDFNFFNDPLLAQIAGREVAAADLVVIAKRGGAELPNNVKVWFSLWVLMHTGRLTAMAALDDNGENPGQASPDILVEDVGRLGSVNLFTLGGDGLAAAELKRVMQSTLAGPSQEVVRGDEFFKYPIIAPAQTSVDREKGCFWLGQAAPEEEHLRRSRTACSGRPPVYLSSIGRCKKTAATKRMLI